ncbi:MAG: hypothetical protein EOO68_19655 [Moraxellaceae bacterium]|jgi:hypothetical protein|nr:MAG: hypothetical protein EOO68_19655 [Moraxellaceae bacterium]
MYESKQQAPITQAIFVQRLFRQLAWVMVLLAVSLLLGMIGYVVFEGLSWIDAFINAAMLLGGMGPINAPQSFAGKLFAGLFALYAGLVFIVAAALLFTPVLHRLLHHFHWDKN